MNEAPFLILLSLLRSGTTSHRPAVTIEDQDWPELMRCAAAHRVLPQLEAAVRDMSLPDKVRVTLRNELRAIAVRNSRLEAMSAEIVSELADAGVQAIPVKGPELDTRFNGAGAPRQFDDLDFLVSREEMPAVIPAFECMPFERICPVDTTHLERWLNYGGEITMYHREIRAYVDFSTLAGHRYVARDVPILHKCSDEGVQLSESEYFLYLVVHGYRHSWCRLRWLFDLALFLRNQSGLDVGTLQSELHERGRVRVVSDALHLTRDVLGDVIPEEYWPLMVEDSGLGHRIRMYRRVLESDEVFEDAPLPLRLQLHLLSCERLKDRLSYLSGLLFRPSPADFQTWSLPERLGALYYPLRPLSLLRRRLQRAS